MPPTANKTEKNLRESAALDLEALAAAVRRGQVAGLDLRYEQGRGLVIDRIEAEPAKRCAA